MTAAVTSPMLSEKFSAAKVFERLVAAPEAERARVLQESGEATAVLPAAS